MQIFIVIMFIVLALQNIILTIFLLRRTGTILLNQQTIYEQGEALANLLDTVHHDAEFALQLKRQIETSSVEQPDPDEEYLTEQFVKRTGGDLYDGN